VSAVYQSKREPRAKQAEALAWIRGRTTGALLMGRRVGKTKVIVDEWGKSVASCEIIRYGAQWCYMRDLLIVAPGGVYRTWDEAVDLDLDEGLLDHARILVWDSSRAGTRLFCDTQESFLVHDGPRILIMNAEALSVKKGDKRARKLAAQFVGPGCTMVIDESVIIKNREANVSKFCCETLGPRCGRRFILTGLVSPRDPLDVYAQFRFLDRRILPETFPVFRSKYAEVNYVCTLPDRVVDAKYRQVLKHEPNPFLNRSGKCAEIIEAGGWVQCRPVIKEWKNIEELGKRLDPWSFRARLEDCYDLPPSDYSFRDVEMTPQQARAYAEMRDLARIEFETQENAVTANQVVVQMLRLHQVLCGHTKLDDGRLVHLPENRTTSLLELLNDHEGKAIIWCAYGNDLTRVVDALINEYGAGSVAVFYGGNLDVREDQEKAFKTNPCCRFMVATPDAGGRGRTWDGADLVVYYSQRNNLDHRLQSEDRAKNVGKTRSISYVDMRVPGTVEDKIIDALRKKMDLSAMVEGTDPLEWLV
jgi:SNF2 family DNA or RNA helicase